MSKIPLVLIVVGSSLSLIAQGTVLVKNHIATRVEQAIEQYKEDNPSECEEQ